MSLQVQPIGFVRANRREATDDFWGGEESRIELVPTFDADALRGLDTFSHAEVLFWFHEVAPSSVVIGARRPRDNPAWPEVGIFAQRGRARPNRIGSTICRITRVEGATVHVIGLDAIDGTPVLDIKPVMTEFLPRETVRQPKWAHELMRDYWSSE